MAAFVTLFTVIIAVAQRDSLSAGLAGLAVTYSLQVRTPTQTVCIIPPKHTSLQKCQRFGYSHT